MTTKCFTPLRGKRIRVTKLDGCGAPPASAAVDAFIVTGGFVTVSLSSEIEDGAEIIQKRADGALCVNERFASSFKRFNVEIEFCQVNPSLFAMITNAEVYEGATASDIIGMRIPEGEFEKYFSFELWTGVANAACGAGGYKGGYLLMPFVGAGTLGDLEIGGEDAINFKMQGAFTKGGNSWGVGPYDVLLDDSATPVAGPLPTALDPLDHLLIIETDVAPPAESCDPMPMPTAA